MWYTYIYLPHRSLTQVPAQVAPAEDWPGPSADVDDLQLVEGGEQGDDDDNDDADADDVDLQLVDGGDEQVDDDDALQLVEGGEQVDDSCSSAGEFSPGSRQEQWGNNYLINKLIAIGDD